MKRTVIIISFLALACCLSYAEDTSPTLPDSQEFTKLRNTIASRDDYNPKWDADDRTAIFEAHKEKDYRKAITLAEKWLAKLPVDTSVMYVTAFNYLRLRQYSEFSRMYYQYLGLIDSILSSGDGKTVNTAYHVISLTEEYAVLNELKLELEEQALVSGCDAMTCTDRDGNKVVLYFNVSRVLQARKKFLIPDK